MHAILLPLDWGDKENVKKLKIGAAWNDHKSCALHSAVAVLPVQRADEKHFCFYTFKLKCY